MLHYLGKYLRKYRWMYISGALFVVLTNLFRVIGPRIVQHAIDLLKPPISFSFLKRDVLLIVAVAALQGIFLFLMRRTIIVASRKIEFDLRNDFFRKLEALSRPFYDRFPTGDIMSRATNDLNAVRSMLGPGIAYFINTIFAFLMVIPMMLIISPILTLLALIPFPIMAVLVNRFGAAIRKRFDRIQAQLADITSFAQENFSGMFIIKAFAQERNREKKFRELNETYVRKNLNYARIQAAFHPTMIVMTGISVLIILLGGGRLVIQGTITIGEFTAFMLYMGMLVWPSIALGWVVGLFQQGAASMQRMRQVLDAVPSVSEGSIRVKCQKLRGEIEFRQLTFGYRENQPVLQDISLHIPAQSVLGIIGPTGSGKSTLTKLIPRLYPLPDGMLFVDGQDVNHYHLPSLRRCIGVVTQDAFLFSDTIRNNILFGAPEASAEEVEQVARIAAIHEEIMDFPESYESVLGERGINLSGGQKQRIALARALLPRPRILILDDAFSALDTHTEEKILTALRQFFSDMTVLIISHRISTLQNAHHIVVLEDGRITESGTHVQLLERKGWYYRVYVRQLLEQEIERVE